LPDSDRPMRSVQWPTGPSCGRSVLLCDARRPSRRSGRPTVMH